MLRWPVILWGFGFLSLSQLGLAFSGTPALTPAQPRIGGPPVEFPGLHNVIRVSEKLFSGSSPEGEQGFASLKQLEIRVILSVDGARPEAARARKLGLRYVHLPIGYAGVSQEMALKLARAVRDLPGPIYLHCHHGKHRSPAAAAAAQFCLDPQCTVAQAVDIMKRAGTDPRYRGLYAAPGELRRPTKEELDRVRVELLESARIPALAEAMVRIDQHWENLVAVRQASWKAPSDHPDLDPAHEALQLWEHYRELGRLAEAQKRPEDFRKWLEAGERFARELEKLLRDRKVSHWARRAESTFQSSRQVCSQCHGRYRDVPQK